MALTDDQVSQLKEWAFELGRDGVLHDPSDGDIVRAVFDRAEIDDMRTEDEFEAHVTIDDMPATEDWNDIVAAWDRGNRERERFVGS